MQMERTGTTPVKRYNAAPHSQRVNRLSVHALKLMSNKRSGSLLTIWGGGRGHRQYIGVTVGKPAYCALYVRCRFRHLLTPHGIGGVLGNARQRQSGRKVPVRATQGSDAE
jgi:hypothetical protein